MSDWTFGDPRSNGDQFKASENVGRLVAFVEPERKLTTTKFGEQEATSCRYVVILDGDAPGTVLADVLIFGNISKDAYANGEERIVLGRVGVGQAKAGQSAPFILTPAEDADKAKAAAWFGSYAKLNAAGRILIDAA